MFVVFKFIVEDCTYGQYCIPPENMGMSLLFCTIQWVHSEYNNLYCIVNMGMHVIIFHKHSHTHTHTTHRHNTHTTLTCTHTTHTTHTNTHTQHTHTTHTQHTHTQHTHTLHVTVTVVVGCVFLILAIVGKYTGISNRYTCKRYSSTWISHDHQIYSSIRIASAIFRMPNLT